MNKCIDCGKKLSTKYSKRCHFHANLKILAERNYIHSDETKIKISNNTKKAMLSQIIIDKISKSKIGKVPWNKNKEYSDNEKQKLNIDGLILGHGWNKGTKGVMKVNSTSFKKGQKPWNTGNNSFNEQEYKKNYARIRRNIDFNFRLLGNLRHRVYMALKGICKSERTMKLVGCSIEELKNYLKKQFTTGMSWNNYGKWHIDHIKPCVKFDLSKVSEQRRCFHYTNLQPLWAVDNLSKGKKIKISGTLKINYKSIKDK